MCRCFLHFEAFRRVKVQVWYAIKIYLLQVNRLISSGNLGLLPVKRI